MNIYLILALIFVVDNGYAFAPASSSLTQCSKLYLYSARASDKEHVVLSANSNTKDPIVSAREARVSGPFAILLSQALPKAAFAKGVNQFDETVKIYFPGSIPSTTVLLRVQSTLRKRQYQPYNTILASSISSDEIVNTPTSVVNLLRNKLSESKDGGVYTLGGLGGIPFTGSAGIDDLLSHAPKDGRIMIYFGPQVGIDKNGNVGMVERIGTTEYGSDEACGAVVRAYKSIISGKEASSGSFNMEEDYIVGLLKKMPLKEYQSKGGDGYAIAKITQNLYGVIENLIQKEVERGISKKNNFWDRVTEVTMMGGIIINRGHGGGESGDDYFQPLMMKTLVRGGEVVDLYGEVFGDLGAPRGTE